jgi:predicted DNA-binding transcriptional regulator YafY
MSRAARILELVELLRGAGLVGIEALAESLEVDRRTVLRDLATLRERGWPIRSASGPGGGVYLDRDRGLAAVHLATEQVAALWLASKLSASVSTLPWSSAARSALAKVFASIPRERGRALRRILDRVVVGRPASDRIRAELGEPTGELLGALEQALGGDRCLAFDYVDRHLRRTRRSVEPHGLLVEVPAWYVLARDLSSGDARMFRMDRIANPRVLARTFVPDFDGLREQALRQR